MEIDYDKDFEKVMVELQTNFGWINIEALSNSFRDLLNDTIKAVKNCSTPDGVKSLPNDDEVKAHIDTLPYYGTCTTEYNEGFEDGVKWIKEQLAK